MFTGGTIWVLTHGHAFVKNAISVLGSKTGDMVDSTSHSGLVILAGLSGGDGCCLGSSAAGLGRVAGRRQELS